MPHLDDTDIDGTIRDDIQPSMSKRDFICYVIHSTGNAQYVGKVRVLNITLPKR